MRTPSVFDPRYIAHAQPTANGLQTARCRVFRSISGTRPEWQAGVGNVSSNDTQIWEGSCRVQPDIDWRTRTRDVQGEWDSLVAVRFQLPMLHNEYQAERDTNGNIVTYSADPEFAFGDIIQVVSVVNAGQSALLQKRFNVRNVIPSTNMWLYDLVTDVGTTLHG